MPAESVSTVYEQAWSTLQNGQLLALAEQAGFDVFVTTDQKLKYQQQIAGRRLAILVLGSTSWPRIKPHSAARQTVEQLTPGAYYEFPIQ